MFQSNTPIRFWSEVVLHAVYLLNRLPTQTLSLKTPYEMLHEREHTYEDLKCFDNLFFATNVYPHKDKFTPRDIRCIFLDYSPGQKGYKLYDLGSFMIIVSRDVRFHEEIYPFKTTETVVAAQLEPILPIPHFSDTQNIIYESKNINDTLDTPPHTDSQEVYKISESPEHSSSTPEPIPIRHSNRTRKLPSWINDYVATVNNVSHHIFNPTSIRLEIKYKPFTYPYIAPKHFINAHMSFIANLSTVQEPTCYLQARLKPEWIRAMIEEINAIKKKKT